MESVRTPFPATATLPGAGASAGAWPLAAGSAAGLVPRGNLDVREQALIERTRALAQLSRLVDAPPALVPPQVQFEAMSADVVVEEARRNRDKAQETAAEGGGAARRSSVNLQPIEEAAQRYSSDLAGGLRRWVSANGPRALAFGVQVLTAAVAAVASGGASLAVDGPRLAATGLAIASEVLRESGINLDRVVGDVLSVSLQALGVAPDKARAWGDTLAATAGAAMELTLFFTSNGQYRMDSARFGALAAGLSEAVGADAATAALVRSTVTGLAAVGLSLASGEALASIDSARSLYAAADTLGATLWSGLAEGRVDVAGLMAQGGEVHTRFQSLLDAFASDTGVADFWRQAGALAGQLAEAALSALQPQVPQFSLMQA